MVSEQGQTLSLSARRVALSLIGTAGLLSTLSSSLLLGYILWCVVWGRNKSPLTMGVRNFAQSAMGRYFVALMFFDVMQGLAFTMDLHWAGAGEIANGHLCVAQGFISQIGDLGIAIFSMVIAFHTFWLLFLQQTPARWMTIVAPIVAISLILIIPIIGSFAVQSSERGQIWGPSGPGAWCWLSNHYMDMRIPFLYLWVFLSLLSSSIIYPLVYLKFKRYIRQDSATHGFSFRGFSFKSARQTLRAAHARSLGSMPLSGTAGEAHHVSRHALKIARRLMWYPIVYTVVVIPVAICRLGGLANWEPPFLFYSIAGICFASSGVADTCLFLFTRSTFIQTATEQPNVRITTHRIIVGDVDLDGDMYSPGSESKSPRSPLRMVPQLRFSNSVIKIDQPDILQRSEDEDEMFKGEARGARAV